MICNIRGTGFAKGLLSAGLALGRAAAVARVPLAAARLREILASGASLRLQFPAEDLGFVYSGSGAAVMPDAAHITDASEPAPPGPGALTVLVVLLCSAGVAAARGMVLLTLHEGFQLACLRLCFY